MQAGKYRSRTSLVFFLEASQVAFSVFTEDKKQAEKSNFFGHFMHSLYTQSYDCQCSSEQEKSMKTKAHN